MTSFSIFLRSCLGATAAILGSTSVMAQATMTPLPGFGTNGWLAPGTSTPYLTTGNTERGLAYNPQTGNLVLVARQAVAGVSNNVRVLSGATGADLGGLDNTGVSGGTFVVNMVDVAADGAIYVGNLSTSATANFKVYKWASESTGFTTPPSVAFDALSGLARTGDSFAVTGGTGSNPAQFAAAGSTAVSASNFVVGSLDSLNTATAYLSIPGTTTTSNDYRLGLTFVDQATLIGTQGATARMTSFNGTTAQVDYSIALGGAAQRPLDYAVIGNTAVLAVIDSNSSLVTLIDVTDPANPVVLARANNTSGTLAGNTNGVGAVAWGAITGTRAVLYAMSTNQGIQAFQVDLAPLASTTDYGTGCDSLALTGSGLPRIGNSTFDLVLSGITSPPSTAAFVGIGTTVINPGVSLDPIGMTGCFLYSNLDIGLFAQVPVNSVLTFNLPIPNEPNLASARLATQGVAFSTANPRQLASSNGTEVVIGF